MVVMRDKINVNYGTSVEGADNREQHAKDYSSEANCEDKEMEQRAISTAIVSRKRMHDEKKNISCKRRGLVIDDYD